MKNKNINENKSNISAENIVGKPENCFELINKYGTYNVQDTNNTENEFPKIAQGLPKTNSPKHSQPK